jgi:hypothetical protein
LKIQEGLEKSRLASWRESDTSSGPVNEVDGNPSRREVGAGPEMAPRCRTGSVKGCEF